MKGNEAVLKQLNVLLADELTAINQYIVHSEMCADWGYDKLHEIIEKRAIEEMGHAEKLIGRILFLEGTPIVTNLNQIHIGKDVLKQFENDVNAEYDAAKLYNESIQLAYEMKDNNTKTLLEEILKDEEEHIDWIEEQMDQIGHMGIQNYLVEQIG
jgi:bacterioferritin